MSVNINKRVYMNVYKDIYWYMTVSESVWIYMSQCDGITKYMIVYECK